MSDAMFDSPEKMLRKILPNGSSALDVGSGDGKRDSLYVILKEKGYKIQALDADKNVLKSNDADSKDVFDLNKSLEFKENAFDLVVAREIIEHLDNRRNLVMEIYKVLKPGGYALITTPNKHCLLGWCEILRGKGWKGWNDDHKYLYTRKEVRKLFSDVGFSIKGDIGVFPIYYANFTFPIKEICADMVFLLRK